MIVGIIIWIENKSKQLRHATLCVMIKIALKLITQTCEIDYLQK